MNLTSVFLQIKTYIVLFSLKSERKLVKIAHDSRQKLLQDEKACKNTSGDQGIISFDSNDGTPSSSPVTNSNG